MTENEAISLVVVATVVYLMVVMYLRERFTDHADGAWFWPLFILLLPFVLVLGLPAALGSYHRARTEQRESDERAQARLAHALREDLRERAMLDDKGAS